MIYLNGAELPDGFGSNRAGYAMAHETLRATTTGFDEGWVMAPIRSRAGLVVEER